MTTRFRKGAALVTVLALTGAALIVLGGVFSYVAFAQRQTAIALGRDVCRLAAQSEIELAKSAVFYRFMLSLNRSARIIGGEVLGTKSASSFDWFEAYSGKTAKKTIGAKNTVTFADSVENGGCTVKVRVGKVEHPVGTQWAKVTFVAAATRRNPGGTVSRATLAETVCFAQQRSSVFNNAYFVNNYGWFQGSGCTANGDVRANGDMYLDTGCKINGNVYAARNEELGVWGDVNSTGKMDTYAAYRTATYGNAGERARPLYTDPKTGAANPGGYEAPETVTQQDLKDRVHANQALSVEMPYIGDISSQNSEYREWAQELHDADPQMSTIRQGNRTLASVFYDGVGPSGQATVVDASGKTVKAPDYGALVLVGTDTNPIVVNGPVIVPNDVIIKGTVTGQGTIYSGRNIHIVGDIKYKNPPSWSGKSTQSASNADKDMLGLMAKGNIVLGDAKDATMNEISTYLTKQPYVQKYKCDTSDAAIGYPETFGGSYMADEYVSATDFAKCQNAGLADYVPGGYDAKTGKFGKMTTREVGTGRYTTTQERYYDAKTRSYKYRDVKTEIMETVNSVSYDRKYYESVCFPSEITSRATTITRIDAVLYNNHGIFGKIGQCAVNGALVCRNEGIRYSTALYLNWDIRLYSGSNEAVSNDKVGLAKSSDASPVTLWWMELPEGVVTMD